MAKKPRPHRFTYTSAHREQRCCMTMGPDAPGDGRPLTADEDARLDRVVAGVDKAALGSVLAQAARNRDPRPHVYHAPATGKVFGASDPTMTGLLDAPGCPWATLV
jgi:hypothetical protein